MKDYNEYVDRLICHEGTQVFNTGKSVGIVSNSERGTCFSLGAGNFFITNNHVMDSPNGYYVDYNYYHTNCSSGAQTTDRIRYEVSSIISQTEGTLDYSLFTIDDFDYRMSRFDYLFGGLSLDIEDPEVNEIIYLPNHTNSLPTMVSAKTGTGSDPEAASYITSVESNVIRYLTQSGPGASGSPVISLESDECVGVHFSSSGSGIALKSSDLWEVIKPYLNEENIRLPAQDNLITHNSVEFNTFSSFDGFEIIRTFSSPVSLTALHTDDYTIEHYADHSLLFLMKKNTLTAEEFPATVPLKLWLENDCGRFPLNGSGLCSSNSELRCIFTPQLSVEDYLVINKSWLSLDVRNAEGQTSDILVLRFNEEIRDPNNTDAYPNHIRYDLNTNANEATSVSHRASSGYVYYVFDYAHPGQGPQYGTPEPAEGPTVVKMYLLDELNNRSERFYLNVSRYHNSGVYAMNSKYVSDPDTATGLIVEYDPDLNTHVLPGAAYTGNLIISGVAGITGIVDDLIIRVVVNA